ncbi:kinetoplast-associated protein [Tritrichomonas foetus]|uniref:Kinetoplast-associated protein n=1 Tax=Tritrichomonas foetus TaxID=1144522 RepID=A0A1J4KJE8_9EUKA|nr:kinetoplast-associated protein [Tritrichomonas foetus]|eukprot:OHT11064.1 kinetoplast-associated protein [Tritrichomonas foetus]
MTYSSKAPSTSRIETLNQSARAIIAQKDAEIEKLNRQIDEAEEYLQHHNLGFVNGKIDVESELEALQQELMEIRARSEQDFEFLKLKQQREIDAINEKHHQEILALKKQIAKTENNQLDISNKQQHASKMYKDTVSQNRRNLEEMSSNLLETSIHERQNESSSSYVDPEVIKAQRRAKETEKEVEELEKQLNSLVSEQKEKEEQIQFEKAEAKKRKAEAKVAERQKKLQERENEYKNQIAEMKNKYEGEIEKLQNELSQLIDLNGELDDELAKVLAENTTKANNLEALKNSPSDATIENDHNISASSSSRSSRRKESASSSRIMKKGKKVSKSTTSIKSTTNPSQLFADLPFVEAEIIRLTEENNDLRKELRRLDKLAYIAPPK